MSSEQQSTDDVRPCAAGCGFYGSAQTNYMCSKCFKDAVGPTATPMPAPANPAAALAAMATATTTPGPAALPTLAREPSMDDASSASAASAAQAASVAAAAAVAAPGTAGAEEAKEGGSSSEAVAVSVCGAPPVQKKRNRCATCNKKVGLTGIECRCELVFCGLHRYPEAHDCQFDFKAHDRENLKQTVMGGGEFAKIADRL